MYFYERGVYDSAYDLFIYLFFYRSYKILTGNKLVLLRKYMGLRGYEPKEIYICMSKWSPKWIK